MFAQFYGTEADTVKIVLSMVIIMHNWGGDGYDDNKY